MQSPNKKKLLKGLQDAKNGEFGSTRPWKEYQPQPLNFLNRGVSLIRRLIGKITGFPDEVKWFIQRGRYGIADCDYWNLDVYLSRIILKGCQDLEDHGVTTFSKSKTLRKIQYTFWLHIVYAFNGEEMNEATLKNYKQGWTAFRKHFGRLWD